MVKTKGCPPEVRAGRFKKAIGFLKAADFIEAEISNDDDLADAYVTLCIHAGIAAADVICCFYRMEYSVDPDHKQAIVLLAQVDRSSSVHLDTLVQLKTKSAYTHEHSTAAICEKVGIAAAELVEVANRFATS